MIRGVPSPARLTHRETRDEIPAADDGRRDARAGMGDVAVRTGWFSARLIPCRFRSRRSGPPVRIVHLTCSGQTPGDRETRGGWLDL
jgi:hypothetical protein